MKWPRQVEEQLEGGVKAHRDPGLGQKQTKNMWLLIHTAAQMNPKSKVNKACHRRLNAVRFHLHKILDRVKL